MGCFSAEHLEAWSCADPWSCSTQWREYHKEAGRRKVNWCLIGVEVRTPVLRVMRAEKRSWPSRLDTRLTTDRAQRGKESRLHRKTGTMWQTWGTVSDTEPAGSSASVQGLWQGGSRSCWEGPRQDTRLLATKNHIHLKIAFLLGSSLSQRRKRLDQASRSAHILTPSCICFTSAPRRCYGGDTRNRYGYPAGMW